MSQSETFFVPEDGEIFWDVIGIKSKVNKFLLDSSYMSYDHHSLQLTTIYKYNKRAAKFGYKIDIDEFLLFGYGCNILRLSLCLLNFLSLMKKITMSISKPLTFFLA